MQDYERYKGLISSHSTNGILEKFYLDPKILTAIETAALKVRVFGHKIN